MTLQQRADRLLRDALEAMPAGASTKHAREVLEGQRVKLAAPLRIALAGRVSAGKSTLVNALVRAPVAVTGKGPVTLAVSVLQYADAPRWTVHYRDGSMEDVPDLDSLAAFTARAADGTAPENGVEFVQVLGAYPCLRQFDLVDTPGFDSPHGRDTEEAMRAIGADADSVMKASAERLRSADAIIAVLQHAVSGPDADVLRRFHSAGGEGFSPTAITSMAVLTKVEEYWTGADDPLETGKKHAARVWADPATRRMFHRVLPVCSKIAEAAAVFTEDEFGALEELTTASAATLDRRLRNVAGFIRDDTLPLSADDRKRLIGVFHRYGLWLACDLIRRGVDHAVELRRELEERSGLPELRRELTERFAGHAGLIKTARAVQEVRGIPARLPPEVSDRDRDVIGRAIEAITDLESTEPTFAEFDLLRRRYAGEIQADEAELAELERALGEHGMSVAERLGLSLGAEPDKLERAASRLLDRWNGPSAELGSDGRVLARVLKRRYEELYDRARRSQAVLADVALFGDELAAADGADPAPASATGGPGEPVLVVDLGTTTTSAILLDGGGWFPIGKRRSDKDWWPTSVCEKDGRLLVGRAAEAHRADSGSAFRTEFKPDIGSTVPVMHGESRAYTAEDLAAEMLKALRDEAAALRETSWAPVSGPPRRLLVTVPAQTDGRRRDAMIRAGLRAGFTDVELLPEPVAAAFSVVGDRWQDGTVLVYDFGGGTFDAALIWIDETHRVVSAGLPDGHGGRDVDAAIVRAGIEHKVEKWLRAVPGRETDRDDVMASARAAAVTLKEDLTEAVDGEAVRVIAPGLRATLNRAQLSELTESLLKDTVECCKKLISDAGLGPADIKGVLLAGGSTWMPVVLPYVRRHLAVGGPVLMAPNPVLAVAEGAARWAESAASRRAFDQGPLPLRVPLSWSLPDGRGTLVRWLVERHESYPPGAALARVRLPDNSLFDLRARAAGRVEQQHAWPGDQLYSGSWLVTSIRLARPGDVLAEPEEVRLCRGAATALAVSPDGRRLAAACQDPPSVTIFDTVTGRRLLECRVDGRVACLAWAGGTRPVFGLSSEDGLEHGVSVLDDAPEGAVVSPRQLTAAATAVLDLAYLPGGREIVIVCGDRTLRILDAITGQELEVLKPGGRLDTLAVSGDGRRIAVNRSDAVGRVDAGIGVVHVIERDPVTQAWAVTQSPPRLPAPASALDFGSLLLAGGGQDGLGYLVALDVTMAGSRGAQPERWRRAPIQPVTDVSSSRDGGLFAVATETQVWVGDPETGEQLSEITLTGAVAAVAFSPEGDWLYVVGDDGIQKRALTQTLDGR
jgi:actin-like ATPase involved in cell morphogenesis/WD40 repeat protein